MRALLSCVSLKKLVSNYDCRNGLHDRTTTGISFKARLWAMKEITTDFPHPVAMLFMIHLLTATKIKR